MTGKDWFTPEQPTDPFDDEDERTVPTRPPMRTTEEHYDAAIRALNEIQGLE